MFLFPIARLFRRHRARLAATSLRFEIGSLLLLLLAGAGPLLAFPSAVTFDRADPFDGAALLVARTAADDPLDAPTFQLKADLYFDNASLDDETVTFVRFDYPGSTIPPRIYTPLGFDQDGNAFLFELPAGDEGRVPIHDGLDRDLPLPLPATVEIRVFVGFDPAPLLLTLDLKPHENDVPLGAYFFPARASDLEPDELWSFGTRHTVDSGGGGGTLNPSTVTQRYALDMGVVRWTGSGWSRLEDGTDGSENSHYLVWDKPLYAMHDGVIIACYRGEIDHDPASSFDDITFDNGFGNSVEILHGGETTKIAHMRYGWPTPDLCPDPGLNEGLSIPVQAGQFLGRAGNTGRSTNPHIHFQAERAQGVGAGTVSGVPMQFVNLRARGDVSSIDNLGNATLLPLHGLTLHRHSLVLPNPCGWEMPDTGFVEVARHGVSAECYQDVFHLIVARGYRPVWVDGYDVNGDTFFNAVFRPAGPANAAFHGLTGAEYQALFDDLTDDGFRLHQVDSYLDGGGVRYAAIFEQRPGPPWAAFHGFTDAEYADELDALADDGFVPVNVSTVEWNGDLYWTALFEQVPVAGWSVHSVPVADYQSVFDDNVAAGRDPITVHGFAGSSGPFLSAVFVDPLPDDWSASHGLDATAYQATWNANTSAGRFTRAVTGYEDGAATFAAIWRARSDTAIDSGPPLVTNQTAAAFELSSDDPFVTFECRLDTGSFAPCSSSPALGLLAEGEHTFSARARDRESLRDLTPAAYTWLVDVTPPEVDVVFPGPNTKIVHGVTKNDFVEMPTIIGWGSIVATASDALSGLASVVFAVDGVPVPGSEVAHDPVAGTWTYELHPDQNGEHIYVIEVTATDQAANSASASIQIVGVATGKKQK